MKCPLDQETLLMAHREGIEIDYCPTCRGVWLDRGELDKLTKAETQYSTPSREASSHKEPQREYRDENRYHGEHGHHKKRESFLENIFDF